jgi:Trp operon repressor
VGRRISLFTDVLRKIRREVTRKLGRTTAQITRISLLNACVGRLAGWLLNNMAIDQSPRKIFQSIT